VSGELKARIEKLRDELAKQYVRERPIPDVWKSFMYGANREGFNVALELLWPCVEASIEWDGICGRQQETLATLSPALSEVHRNPAAEALTHIVDKLEKAGIT